MDRFNGHRFPVALAAFVVFFGCDQGSPTSPSAAKSTEVAVEQCPMPILGIAGTWARPLLSWDSDAERYVILADTLRIEFAPDPNPAGEPGVTYYNFTLLSYALEPPRDLDLSNVRRTRWDSELADFLALALAPPLLSEVRGKMGVYYADGGTWAFNYVQTYSRRWSSGTKEYIEFEGPGRRHWGNEVKMFNGWLVLGWVAEDVEYKRVDQ